MGNIEYPVPFVISFYNEEKNTGYDSEIFFVEKGEINIKVNDLEKDKSLGFNLHSKSQNEFIYLKKNMASGNFNRFSENKIIIKRQNLLTSYIKLN